MLCDRTLCDDLLVGKIFKNQVSVICISAIPCVVDN